jgi:hypothetical protein
MRDVVEMRQKQLPSSLLVALDETLSHSTFTVFERYTFPYAAHIFP